MLNIIGTQRMYLRGLLSEMLSWYCPCKMILLENGAYFLCLPHDSTFVSDAQQ